MAEEIGQAGHEHRVARRFLWSARIDQMEEVSDGIEAW